MLGGHEGAVQLGHEDPGINGLELHDVEGGALRLRFQRLGSPCSVLISAQSTTRP